MIYNGGEPHQQNKKRQIRNSNTMALVGRKLDHGKHSYWIL